MTFIFELLQPIWGLLQMIAPQLFLLFKRIPFENMQVRSDIERDKPVTFLDQVKNLYIINGGTWDKQVNIFGISNEAGQAQDIWNDYIVGCFFINDKWEFMSCLATTNPSVYWKSKKNQKKAGWAGEGAAHMRYGWHPNIWMVGKHRGYRALAQWGNKVNIWRDHNENFLDDDDEVLRKKGISNIGYFGINLHHGWNAIRIGLHSAGCQVIQKILVFKAFLKKIMTNDKHKANSKSKYSYLLLNMDTMPVTLVEKIKGMAV